MVWAMILRLSVLLSLPSHAHAVRDAEMCSVPMEGYNPTDYYPSVELDTDGTWRAYCVPKHKN